jgi:hypothetical protein
MLGWFGALADALPENPAGGTPAVRSSVDSLQPAVVRIESFEVHRYNADDLRSGQSAPFSEPYMKPSIPVICVLILAWILPLQAQQKGPAIEFDSITKELSKIVYDGEVINQIFKFTNKGDATLEILKVEPACGCTSAVPTPNKLSPGQSGQLEINIATLAITVATAQKTELNKTVTVTTNDPNHPSIVLSVTGMVAPEVSLSQPNIWFGSNPAGKEVTQDLIAEIAPDRAIKILGATSTDPNVAVRLEPLPDSSGKKVKVILVQKPTTAAGMHSGEVVLQTDSKLKPEVRFTVRGLVAKSN